MDSTARLAALRAQMTSQGIDAFFQPVHDEYMNEYPPESSQRVKWLTGFAGSAGVAVVTKDKAALFTDGRYTLQAAAEAPGFEQHNVADLAPEEWLADALPAGRVGYDAKLTSRSALRRMESALKAKHLALVAVENPVDAIWKDRPPAPATPVFAHALHYAGEASEQKRKRLADKLDADAALIAAPDSVCWLLNIRANDVEGAPLLLAPLILHKDGKAQLFVSPLRISEAVRAHLGADVSVIEPPALESSLAALKGKKVLIDTRLLPVWYLQRLEKAGAQIVEGEDPCQLPKAMKNATELAGMREAHLRDGAAIVQLLHWLDQETQKRPVRETEIVEKLLGFRSQQKEFAGPSFATISGSGPNGAIVHYRVSDKTDRALGQGELFLLDSGGQYPGGTTDITRTVAIGAPSPEHKDRFTRVLKGHIAIAMAVFPEGTSGSQLDVLARTPLWQAGLDYDHGTGHGVGCFLNVHEGPQRIGKRGGDAPLAPGMIVSNEPGYYKSGEYGIRIENLVAVKEHPSAGHPKFFGFETITCAPIDTRLVDPGLLTQEEKQWLNAYHAWVEAQLSPRLPEALRPWLKARCTAV